MNAPLAIEARSGEGVPVLFIHGFSHHRHVWDELIDELPDAHRAITYDLRGHGDSPWSIERDYQVDDHAADVGRVLDQLSLERAILVGHSLGGLAAIRFAARHPDRVLALVLVDTGPRLSLAGVQQITSDGFEAPACFAHASEFEAWLEATMPFTPEAGIRLLAHHALVRRRDGALEPKLDPALLEAQVDADAMERIAREIESALAQIQCPTLLVRGGLSALLSEENAKRIVREQLAEGELVTLPEAGHAVMLDAPAALGAALEAFFARGLGARSVDRNPALASPSSARRA